MKHILATILSCSVILFAASSTANAQKWHVGGEFTSFYAGAFKYDITPMGGYEFNDKIAVQAALGVTGVEDISRLFMGAYFRYTPWHNNVFYLDLRFRTEVMHDFDFVDGADIGITPMFRFRCDSHWDFYTSVGSLGIRYQNDEWTPCIGVITSGVNVGVIYRFN